jgi:hypothetical protein
MQRIPDLRAAQEYLDGKGWVDMEVYSGGSRSSLIVAMDSDLTYHHEAALVFSEPSYFSGPLSWTSASDGGRILRLLSADERTALADAHADAARCEGYLFEIRTDEETSVLIGAADLGIDRNRVYYYQRDDLAPGETLAYWLQPTPSQP